MTSFLLVSALIFGIAFLVLAWPLFRSRHTVSYARESQNIHFAKERLDELEQQLKNAAISAAEYEALKLEIESTLAQDIDLNMESHLGDANEIDVPVRSNKLLIASLFVLIPTCAYVVYSFTGTPEGIEFEAQALPSQNEIVQMVSQIETTLKDNPNDVRGWQVIAPIYKAMGRLEDAQNAYRQAINLGATDARNYAELADIIALKQGGMVNSDALELARKALALEPNNQIALWLAGLGSLQQGANGQAQEYWNRLLPLLADFPEQQAELQEIISQSFSDDAGITANDGIQVSIEIADEVQDLLQPNDAVFVFARAKNGPPAPLAVKRLQVSDLPATVMLSDNDAMMNQLRLSLFDDVVVSARVSKSNNPIASAGDVESQTVDSRNDNTDTIKLFLNSIVE